MFWSNGYAYGTFSQIASAEGRSVIITAMRGEVQLSNLVLRNHGRVQFDQPTTIRSGDTATFNIPANDSLAGVPSLDLTRNERLLVVKPPRVSTGKNVFQKEVYFRNKTTVELEEQTPDAAIHYTLDGSEPTLESPRYAGPIPLDRSGTIRAVAVANGRFSVVSPPVRFERITGTRDVEIRPEPAPEYAGHGPLTLVDGKRGNAGALGNEWLGFQGEDLDVLVDLGETRLVKTITAGFLSDQRRWVFLPVAAEYAVGTTRKNLQTVYTKKFEAEKLEQPAVRNISAKVSLAVRGTSGFGPRMSGFVHPGIPEPGERRGCSSTRSRFAEFCPAQGNIANIEEPLFRHTGPMLVAVWCVDDRLLHVTR